MRSSEQKTCPDEGVKSVKEKATKSLTSHPIPDLICEGGGCSSETERETSSHKKPPAIIICHGSFNPVHKHHLKMMETAKHCLEANGFEVKYGIMAITAQGALHRKCKKTLSNDDRMKLINQACKEPDQGYEWIHAEGRGVRFNSGTAFAKYIRSQDQHSSSGVTVFKVIGADNAIKYDHDIKDPTMVIGRSGYTEQLLVLEETLRTTSVDRRTSDLYFCHDVLKDEISSTKLRIALDKGDITAIYEGCPSPNVSFLTRHWYSSGGESTMGHSPIKDNTRKQQRHLQSSDRMTTACVATSSANYEPQNPKKTP